jgi:hypothetical protein
VHPREEMVGRAAELLPPSILKFLKNIDFVGTVISSNLHDFPISVAVFG